MKEILEEPTGNTYKQLVELAFSVCDEFTLVKREQLDLNENAQQLLKELKPYIKEIKKQNEWPGTKLLGHYADVYYFDCKQELKEILIRNTDRLYQWVQPELLEDLCFFKNKNVWLVTIAHEREGRIFPTDHNEIQRITEIEGMLIS